MDDIDVALTNYERELRGQRELVLSGGELKAFTDEQAGKLLYPNMTAAELKAAKKPDYIAETADRLIIGDSKGGGSVDTSIRQIEPALSSDYVKDAIAAGKKIECRVYLDAEEAARLKLVGRGHPPVLHKIGEDGKEIAYGVGGLPLYVVFN